MSFDQSNVDLTANVIMFMYTIIFRDHFLRSRLILFVQAQLYSNMISHYVIVVLFQVEFCSRGIIKEEHSELVAEMLYFVCLVHSLSD